MALVDVTACRLRLLATTVPVCCTVVIFSHPDVFCLEQFFTDNTCSHLQWEVVINVYPGSQKPAEL